VEKAEETFSPQYRDFSIERRFSGDVAAVYEVYYYFESALGNGPKFEGDYGYCEAFEMNKSAVYLGRISRKLSMRLYHYSFAI
jgi:hypothetical protein